MHAVLERILPGKSAAGAFFIEADAVRMYHAARPYLKRVKDCDALVQDGIHPLKRCCVKPVIWVGLHVADHAVSVLK
jgi:hypothetical protein